MTPRALLALAVCAVLGAPALAGCLSLGKDDEGASGSVPTVKDAPGAPANGTAPVNETPAPPPARVEYAAPWWDEGQWFEITFSGEERPERTHRLVTFLNDSETSHFWLGVEDREVAMEHAFFDTNPFLGRIHHDVLSPHESGQHAGMFDFPLYDGKLWQGFFFKRDWDFTAEADPAAPGRFVITGTATDGATIRYDYDPAVEWWSRIVITAPDGARELEARVDAHGKDARGTYWFERGRDYYAGPETREGAHSETFDVTDEGLDFLAVNVQVTTNAPLVLEVLDPAGEVRERIAVGGPTGGSHDAIVEIPGPAKGTWSIRYTTPGRVDGSVLAVGLFEYSGTV